MLEGLAAVVKAAETAVDMHRLTGVVAGGLVTVRALRRRPRPHELKAAAAHTGADILGLAARAVRAPRR